MPDGISVAKALTSGYVPMAAVTVPEPMYQALLVESRKIGSFGHGFTYSGHPVAAAVALKALEIYARDRLFEAAAQKTPQFQARLHALGQHALVGEARGLGLIGAIGWSPQGDEAAVDPKAGVAPRAVRFAEDEADHAASAGDAVSVCRRWSSRLRTTSCSIGAPVGALECTLIGCGASAWRDLTVLLRPAATALSGAALADRRSPIRYVRWLDQRTPCARRGPPPGCP